MKKVCLLVLMALMSISATLAQAEFAWSVGGELVSAYIWRGQYQGGLSFQPDLSLGFDAEHCSLRVGAWGSVGASDWKFVSNSSNPALNTYFVPELDLYAEFAFFGVHLGATHYYYFDGSKFFSGFKNPEGTSQTDVKLGYHFADEFDFGLYVEASTYILGEDGYYETTLGGSPVFHRYFSTYVEVGYEAELPAGFTLKPALGIAPQKRSCYFEDDGEGWTDWNHLGFTNLSLRLDKEWELGDHCTLGLFALGSVNFYDINKDNLWINTSGEDKIGSYQKLNGSIGLSFWFE